MSRLLGLVSAVLLLAIGLRFGLPIVDPNAVEHDPWHTHIVIGASSLSETGQALADHTHRSGAVQRYGSGPQPGDPPPEQSFRLNPGGNPQVLNIAGPQDGRMGGSGFEFQAWLIPSGLWSIALFAWLWQIRTWPVVVHRSFYPLPVVPPPRGD